MSADDLREELGVELENMASALSEVQTIARLVAGREPTTIEKTAAGAFLAQLYGGLENILKRICRHSGVALPQGPRWHGELFRMFCHPPAEGLPSILDTPLAQELQDYRRFRHLFVHGYGSQLDWARMKVGVERASEVFGRVTSAVRAYLDARTQPPAQ
jgi:hypothetical protein